MAKNTIQPGCQTDVKSEALVALPKTAERIEAYRRWYENHANTEESPFFDKKLEVKLDTNE